MRKLILNIILFLTISVLLPSIFFFFLPATPRSKSSLLFAEIDKNALMKNLPSPRIIFIGGSNLSFGLNSQMIKDSLKCNVINTGINAELGLIYMLDNAIKFIREGDIVVVVPEYDHFLGDFAYGGEVLLRTICDVPSNGEIRKLRTEQIFQITTYLPQYLQTKMSSGEYVTFTPDKFYSRNSFNQYGDATAHWNDSAQKVEPYKPEGQLNESVFQELKNFEQAVTIRKAHLFLSYPCVQVCTFNNFIMQVRQVEKGLNAQGFTILGSPERYRMPDSLIFNTPYHLIKKGVDLRTKKLIEDLLNNPKFTYLKIKKVK